MREFMLVVHFIGLAMALGTGFANLFLGRAAAKLEPAERGSFMLKTLPLVRMGQIGLGLLIISGFGLITPYWRVLGEMPILIAKLACVVLLIIVVSIISMRAKKAQMENNPALLASIRPLGLLNFVIAITIIVLAVLTFR